MRTYYKYVASLLLLPCRVVNTVTRLTHGYPSLLRPQVEHSVTQNPRMQLGVRMTTRWPPGPWIKYKQAEADELLGGPEVRCAVL